MLLEVNSQVFPSAIFQLYMVFVLQQDRLEYYISILSSLIGVIMGTSAAVIYSKHEQSFPMKKRIFCYLSACTDITFRILFISFFSSMYSPYASLAIFLIYYCYFYLYLYLSKPTAKLLTKFECISCFYTLPTSNYENKSIKYSLRPKSKLIFNTMALIGLVLITGPVWKSDPTFKEKPLPITNYGLNQTSLFDHCKDICDPKEINLCKSFSLSEKCFHNVLIVLWILWLISTLEGLFEQCFKYMPYRLFCEEMEEKTQDGTKGKAKENKLEDEMECNEFLPENKV